MGRTRLWEAAARAGGTLGTAALLGLALAASRAEGAEEGGARGDGSLVVFAMDWETSRPVDSLDVRLFGGERTYRAAPAGRPGYYAFGDLPAGVYPTLSVTDPREEPDYLPEVRKAVAVGRRGSGAFCAVLLVRASTARALPWMRPDRLRVLRERREAFIEEKTREGWRFDRWGNPVHIPTETVEALKSWETEEPPAAGEERGVTTLVVQRRRRSKTAQQLIEEMKNNYRAETSISKEDAEKTGDSNASEVVKRAVGVSVVGGRYVYVRGLGERYSLSMLNNAYLPSPEPDRRVVPLDLFPTALIDAFKIVKTYSADLPGEFSGGTVQIFTRDIPEARTFRLGLSFGGRTGATGRTFLSYEGGDLDFLGYDDGVRALPHRIPSNKKAILGGIFGGYTVQDMANMGRGFPNHWALEKESALPDTSVSMVWGNTLGKAGFFTSLLWKAGWDIDEYSRVTYKNEGSTYAPKLAVKNDYDFEEHVFGTQWSNLTLFGYRFDARHQVNARLFYVNAAKDRVRRYEGFYNDIQDDIRTLNLTWTERSLLHTQLAGEHRFDSPLPVRGRRVERRPVEVRDERDRATDDDDRQAGLDWRLTLSRSTADSPNSRQVRYDWNVGLEDFAWVDRPGTNQRDFYALEEYILEAGADFRAPFRLLGRDHFLKAGGLYLYRTRQFAARTFRYRPYGSPMRDIHGNPIDYAAGPEVLFRDETIWEGGWILQEYTRATDKYEAGQNLAAGYLMAVLNPLDTLLVNLGLRFEYSRQEVTTFDPFSPDADPITSLVDNADFLPGLQLRWQFIPQMQVRVAFSQTVNRPEFREQAEFEFTDVIGEYAVKGNADIRRASIRNLDVRFEAYPGPGEVLALSFFYKHFTDPIEKILQPTTEFRVSYENAASAYNLGVEAELRLRLDHLAAWLEGFEVVFNASFIYSRVDLSENTGVQTSTERALQGQAPFLLNAVLLYTSPEKGSALGQGWTVSVAFNAVGRKISSVGAAGLPDIYEEPRYDLKCVIRKTLPFGASLKLSFSNLLMDYPTFTQGGRDTNAGEGSLGIQLGLSWKL